MSKNDEETRAARGGRRGFRLRTRRVGVGLKITVTAAEPVLVVLVVVVAVYIVHVAFTAAATTAAGSYLPLLSWTAISMTLPRRCDIALSAAVRRAEEV